LSSSAISKGSGSDLAEVVSTILDKGIVIDANVIVSVVGIRLLSIDARVVIASVDTYLRFAEAANRLDLNKAAPSTGLPDMVEGPKGQLANKASDALGEIANGLASKLSQNGSRQREGS